MTPAAAEVERFARDLAALVPSGRIGIAVSGGPDSLALLLLAYAARPSEIEAATVDHQLREGSAEEAAMVASLCEQLGIPHATLPVRVAPAASLQAQARTARYAALAAWATERDLIAVATAHHADDQAETLLMRLARGSGLSGLAGVRASRPLADGVKLVRPLLGWRKAELEAVVAVAGLTPADDPANRDPRHDRTRAREFLGRDDWPDPRHLATSAHHLADAEEALHFATGHFADRLTVEGGGLTLSAADLPRELQRRLLLAAISRLGDLPPRGPDLDRTLTTLINGGACTLGTLSLRAKDGRWHLAPAPPRRG